MNLVSRRRMYVPPTLCEESSVMHPTSVALFSTCQPGSLSKTRRSGPQESRSLGAITMQQVKTFGITLQETPHLHQASIPRPSAETFKRVRPVSTPTRVRPDSSYIMNRYSISSAKLGTTASVCLYTICEEAMIDNAIR